MKVTVNNIEVNAFQGAKVKDVIRIYYAQQNKKQPKQLPIVRDSYGHKIGFDGSVLPDTKFYIEEKSNENRIKTQKTINKIYRIMKRITLISRLSVVLLLTTLIGACGTTRKGVTGKGQIKELEILTVNDLHAAIDNFPKFAYLVDSLRTVYPDMLLVAGGDIQTGNPVNDQYPEKGLPMIELMNAVGFDLTCVGNHEFDVGQKQFVKLKNKAKFDYICANYHNPTYTAVNVDPYKILTMKNGLKVGIMALLQLNSGGIPDSHPKNVKGIVFENPLEIAPKFAFLRDKCDVFIALNHLGYEDDVRLAEVMKGKGLDLIIGGHTNTLIEKKELHHGTMITQVDWKLKYATLIKVKVKDGKVIDKNMQLIDLRNRTKEKASIRQMVDKYNDNPALKRVIATTDYEFTGKRPLGYLMTDALRELSKVDIVFQNPGGVRIKHLPKGNITVMDMYRMDPFGNEFISLKMTGQEILDFLKVAFVIDEGLAEFVSGAKIKYTLNPDKTLKDVQLFLPSGKPIAKDATYKVGMNSYIVAAYNFKHKDAGTSFFKPTAEYVIEWLDQKKSVKNYQKEQRAEFQN